MGPDRVLEVSNGGVALSTKDGQLVTRTHMWDLFGPAQTVPGLRQSYDPDAIYDPDSGRFFIYAVGQLQNTWKPCDSGCVANEYLAVSRSSSPQSFTTADWYFYELPVTPRRGQRVDYWGDGTTLGVNGKFLGVNMHLYGWGNGQPDVDEPVTIRTDSGIVGLGVLPGGETFLINHYSAREQLGPPALR